MKEYRLITLSLMALFASGASASERFATTSDGHFVILKDDGTWKESKEDGELVDGKVNLALNLLESVKGGCQATFMLQNMSTRSFPDYLPIIRLVDFTGTEIGRSTLSLTEFGKQLPAHGLLYLTASAPGRLCWEVMRATVSGYEGFCGKHAEQCNSVLFVHPNSHLPFGTK